MFEDISLILNLIQFNIIAQSYLSIALRRLIYLLPKLDHLERLREIRGFVIERVKVQGAAESQTP
jgi:hypothetical protein